MRGGPFYFYRKICCPKALERGQRGESLRVNPHRFGEIDEIETKAADIAARQAETKPELAAPLAAENRESRSKAPKKAFLTVL